MSAARKIELPTPRDRLRYHLELLGEEVDHGDESIFLPMVIHHAVEALKALREEDNASHP